ncbi:MAG: IclR family transcriptional regulator [Hyphomonadaceae bacterium]
MPERSIKSSERTLAVFEIFSDAERPLSVSEIVRALGIPQSSTTMLLRNLQKLGYLEYFPHTRKYLPTMRAYLLTSWMGRQFSAAAVFMEAFERLHQEVGELTRLSFQNGAVVQVILGRGASTGSHEALAQSAFGGDHLIIRTGPTLPLTLCAAGRALLSVKPDKEIIAWVRRCNAQAQTAAERVAEPAFMAAIENIRRVGFAETRGDQTPNVGAVAVAMPSPIHTGPLGVFVTMPLERLMKKRDTVVAALMAFKTIAIEARQASPAASEPDARTARVRTPRRARAIPTQVETG